MSLALCSASASAFVAPMSGAPSKVTVNMQMAGNEYAKSLPGTGPWGFFDPLGLTNELSDGQVRYFREVEVKHGRVAMLAAVGFLVGEQFHPLFGGNVDVPSYIAFQATPLQTFWTSVVATIGVIEFFTIVCVDSGFTMEDTFATGEKRVAGDFMFDPLGLKPKTDADLETMQAKEINNGRLAMIGMAGMVVQELVSGGKLF